MERVGNFIQNPGRTSQPLQLSFEVQGVPPSAGLLHRRVVNPFLVVSRKKCSEPNAWAEVMRTEMVESEYDARFLKKLDVGLEQLERDLQPEAVYRVDVYNQVKTSSAELRKQVLVGSALFNVAELLQAIGQANRIPLSSSAAVLFVNADLGEPMEVNSVVTISFKFPDVSTDERLFFIVSRSTKKGGFAVVGRSPPARGGLEFEAISVDLQSLTLGDPERPLRVELFRHRPGGHTLIGWVQTTWARLRTTAAGDSLTWHANRGLLLKAVLETAEELHFGLSVSPEQEKVLSRSGHLMEVVARGSRSLSRTSSSVSQRMSRSL
eukprot:CAMPEP_0198323368 /NCGR_PEP_ID=MMETSP1450-20131203/11636_1 /TAXON_ID=753684 ORGANISM="Madagascaria erythrocladiodes, Strain CCMP3234" /NCGR_SAMPLE_ID=MMETSP1450 /ASSEMBLY_ACC=CAM_ASM_001115 /LENGTH=322 /DNA_ID=CAMNT_0044027063 /DNA_START=97 /DNA_END=1062 /DNA_ORIENTATION=-